LGWPIRQYALIEEWSNHLKGKASFADKKPFGKPLSGS
jgi:hypothetical protein